MTDSPFTPEEEAALYEEIGATASTPQGNTVVIEVPDPDAVEFDMSLIEHLDITQAGDFSLASRILFSKYGGGAIGLPKGSIKSTYNSAIHARISTLLSRMRADKRKPNPDSLREKVKEDSARKVADTAAVSTQAALKVLRDQILTDEGAIDMEKFAALLKEA